MSIRVFVADDHQVTVEGFKVTLHDAGVEVIDVAYSLEDLPRRVADTKPDVLVMDVRFETKDKDIRLDGLDICESVLANNPAAKIVVFSQFDDEYIVEKTYQLGILAYVRKDESPDVLIEAIESANKGKKFFSPAIAQQLAWLSVEASPTKLLDDKELKAFTLIADGASFADVAEAIGLSTKTVGIMVKNIRQKLDIETQADFTKMAIRFGLTTLDRKTKN